jgi:hypothetical protein
MHHTLAMQVRQGPHRLLPSRFRVRGSGLGFRDATSVISSAAPPSGVPGYTWGEGGGVGLRASGLGFRVEDLGFRFRAPSFGFGVRGLEDRSFASGFGFRV